MTGLMVQFFLSASAVVLAGIFLTRCADAIADRTGLGKALVGGIILAAGTSLPELLVDVHAIKANMPDLAVGDLLGSSLFNLLILSIGDLLHRNPQRLLVRTATIHSISASLTIVVTGIASIALFLGERIESLTFGGVGIGSYAILFAYIFGMRMIATNQPKAKELAFVGQSAGAEPMSLKKAVLGYALSGGILFIAAPFLASAAGGIAEITGLGKTFIGTILVALCTSLPELVSTLTAVRIGSLDLAIGNIFGSNSFNMLLFIPLDVLHQGSLLAEVSPLHVLSALGIIVVSGITILGQLNQVERGRRIIEPDALANISLIVMFLGLLYVFRDSQ